MSALDQLQSQWKPYPAYKDSGVEWCGELPEEWDVMALKYACQDSAIYGANISAVNYVNEGIRFIRTSDIDDRGNLQEDGAVYLEAGKVSQEYILKNCDILFSRSGTIGRSFIYKEALHGDCAYAGYLVRFVPAKKLCSDYVFYFSKSTNFVDWLGVTVIESTIGNVNGQKYANMPFPIPSVIDQQAIINFLNLETAKIDSLIAKKQRLIELLQEKRTALISHAVTKGLDPSVPMKDSGIEWLGEIPFHWNIERNKHIFREVTRLSVTGEEELLSVSHITGVSRRSEKEVSMFMAETLEGYKICDPGDLVINTMWAWMGALGISPLQGVVSPSYNVYRLREAIKAFPKYLDYLYRTPQHIMEINRFSKGVWSSRLRLYPKEFFEMYTPLPPLEEQLKIVDYLNDEISRINQLIFKIQRATEILQEYRTALISAAVTGKIDVREVLS